VHKITDIDKGIYILIIQCDQPSILPVKKFNNITFPAGYYYYIGSAQKNMQPRIKRHLSDVKKIHWHIDYLTTNKNFKIKEVILFKNKRKSYECILSQDFLKYFNSEVKAHEFGNSDCTKCISHLYYNKEEIPHNHFISRYQSIVRFIPSSSVIF
jgi:Uri superfamily endonuclease